MKYSGETSGKLNKSIYEHRLGILQNNTFNAFVVHLKKAVLIKKEINLFREVILKAC